MAKKLKENVFEIVYQQKLDMYFFTKCGRSALGEAVAHAPPGCRGATRLSGATPLWSLVQWLPSATNANLFLLWYARKPTARDNSKGTKFVKNGNKTKLPEWREHWLKILFSTKILPLEFSLAVGSHGSHNRKRFALVAEGNHCIRLQRGVAPWSSSLICWDQKKNKDMENIVLFLRLDQKRSRNSLWQ